MPSALERELIIYRAKLKNRDDASLGVLFDAMDDARDRLMPRIALLQADIAGMETPDPNDVLKLTRWLELERQMTMELQRIADALGPRLQADQRAVIADAWNDTRRLALVSGGSQATTARIGSGWARVPTDALRDLVANLQPDAPVGKLLATFGETEAARARATLIEAITRGMNPRAVGRLLEGQLGISRNRAATIARTELLRASRSAAIAYYRENNDLLSGWVWTAAKQRRTCAACLFLDGRTFSLNVTFMASHPACRCTARPRLKGAPATDMETGAAWLNRQPADVQDGILGKGGGAAYRAGDVQLGDFVRKDRSETWGDSYRDGGIGWAREQASARG